ncbi:thiol reductant ABC exporter subunit CydC [Alkalihalobacillus trypoxylicola]|uniref:ABC transporter ATP-binding protein n=1 Tax=Alkalihalobacillus trypoxylicola TaxID=519424 RepID=A0A162CQU1_9BACI|nr:thiol reductant ABC exporter subunit CydC [Alkalihalobacillus trypoxylicola]KYG26057.1 ABC transporter ATP-binding protein [Alkalihalobacillus trypoxylicola]
MKALRTVMKIMLIEKRDIFLSILFGFIAGITAIGLFSASGYLISQAALVPPLYTLMVIVAIVKLLGITSAISRYGERYYSHRGTFTMLSNLRIYIYEKIEPLATTILQKYRSGDLLSRIVGDVESLQNYFLRVFYPPVVIASVTIATILFTTIFSVGTALIIVVGMIFLTVVVPSIFTIIQRKVDQQVRQKRGQLSSHFTEFLYGYRDLKIHQQAANREKQLEKSVKKYEKAKEKSNLSLVWNESIVSFLSLLVSVVVLGFAAHQMSTGQIEGVLIALLFMISLTLFEQTGPLSLFPNYLHESEQAFNRLQNIWREQKQQQKKLKTDLEVKDAPSLSFHDVTFQYEQALRPSLNEVSFALPKGSKTAIVGASGSGKTTILHLILKLYEIGIGEIKWDGYRLESLKEEDIWQASNISLQSNHFFYGTIRDNLLVQNESIDEKQLYEALKHAQLAHLSLDHIVQEKGSNLSGGEKQRLALARLFLRKSKLWLLDEPTSSLDAVTEQQVLQHVFKEAESATLILVSHRLNGLEKMDQIIVMDHGKVVEVGTYDELMNRDSYFKEMKKIEREVVLG